MTAEHRQVLGSSSDFVDDASISCKRLAEDLDLTASLTRRHFCQESAVAAASGLLATTAVSHARAAEDKKLPETIDCHPHFYDPSRPQGIPWPGKGSSLYRTVLPKDLRALPKPRALSGTVIVEASPWVEDNQWLLDLAKDDPFVVGVVGHLTPGEPDFKKHLRRFAANPIYRGMRVSQKEISEPNLSDKAWRADIGRIIDADLELDVNGGSDMVAAVAELAKKIPKLRIVVNHLSNVGIDGKTINKKWAAGMRAAAANKNVFCKVSALVESASRGGKKPPADVEFYRPTLDVAWDAFGDDRLIYGSNWPVSQRAADYATLQQIVLDYVTARGAQSTQKFFADNSKLAYKWVDRPGRPGR